MKVFHDSNLQIQNEECTKTNKHRIQSFLKFPHPIPAYLARLLDSSKDTMIGTGLFFFLMSEAIIVSVGKF